MRPAASTQSDTLDRFEPDGPTESATRLREVLRAAVWPFVSLGTLVAFVVCFRNGAIETSLILVPAVAVYVLFGLEVILPERRGRGVWGDPQFFNDVFHSIVSQGAGNAVGQMLFVTAAVFLADAIGARFGTNLWSTLWPTESPFWVQVIAVVFIADGLDYWRHRLLHTTSWLWPIHALHHSVDRMNVLKSGRGHFLDMLFRSLALYAPLALIGVSFELLMTYAAAVTVLGPVAHSNVSMRLPSWLHILVMTPQVHRIHHARPMALSCSNYANAFPIWDVVFGSFQHPDRSPHFEFGIEDDSMPDGLLGQTLEPFRTWRAGGREVVPATTERTPAH